VRGFRYFDDRDLLGFVDGTENPTGRAAAAAVLTGAGDPGFAGGSYVIAQKYVHDMDAWNGLTAEEQEKVIGRTKLDDIELPDDVKPANSHVALNIITDPDGTELQILRANMPFGSLGIGGLERAASNERPAPREPIAAVRWRGAVAGRPLLGPAHRAPDDGWGGLAATPTPTRGWFRPPVHSGPVGRPEPVGTFRFAGTCPSWSITAPHGVSSGRDRCGRADSRLVDDPLACGRGAGHGGRFQLCAGTGARAR